MAETDAVRIGAHFSHPSGVTYSDLGHVSLVLEAVNMDLQRFVTGFQGCPDLVVRDLNEGVPRDQFRDTWTIIQSFRVECWALLNFEGNMVIAPTEPDDRITPEMIRDIMGKARQLQDAEPEWGKALVTFFGGTITCKDKERCSLQSPAEGDWANYSLDFDLLFVHGNDWFIEVTDAYRGREALVYGVWWREGPSGGRVISVYPVMYWPKDGRKNTTTWQRNWR